MKFTTIDVIKNTCIGPAKPSGIISSGNMIILTQKTPNGGIHAVLRICATVNVDCDTYSTQPLQKHVRMRLSSGVIIHPTRANIVGKKSARPKLQSVRRTPCTIPNVIRSAY